MATNVKKIADLLGAQIVGQVQDSGGGAFGAARLAEVVAALQSRLAPRAGNPTSLAAQLLEDALDNLPDE
jgi:hypothetical protein